MSDPHTPPHHGAPPGVDLYHSAEQLFIKDRPFVVAAPTAPWGVLGFHPRRATRASFLIAGGAGVYPIWQLRNTSSAQVLVVRAFNMLSSGAGAQIGTLYGQTLLVNSVANMQAMDPTAATQPGTAYYGTFAFGQVYDQVLPANQPINLSPPGVYALLPPGWVYTLIDTLVADTNVTFSMVWDWLYAEELDSPGFKFYGTF
jgi:hypothetical protein